MNQATAPDMRPAIAFDSSQEIEAILNALRSHRINDVTSEQSITFIRNLENELLKAVKMFKGE